MPDHSPLPWKKLPGLFGPQSAAIEDAEGHDVVEQIKTDDAELIVSMVNVDPSYEELMSALEESVKHQSHYANLLNGWDGGKRLTFENANEWILRLKWCAKLRP